MFENTNSVNLCQNSVLAKLSGCQKWDLQKKVAFVVFVCVCFFMLLQEKQKNNIELAFQKKQVLDQVWTQPFWHVWPFFLFQTLLRPQFYSVFQRAFAFFKPTPKNKEHYLWTQLR